ncbi:hypothetical protein [Aliarcobacter cryaerophilus]|uniref:hypothetical protein n=1 Tax=Aliarcobacter cryaerophilus TaxID=28198 RepID=UPI0021B1B5CC|nr:hypothetical protein [Aliarcobacter cryaerophilus]MCT7544514.1 hypothetical protein [Aliarcobacter cryaerophilus]
MKLINFLSKYKKEFKFSTIFILVLILLKLTYLYFEIDYNGSLINLSTKYDIAEKELKDLEKYGHTLSSIGLTLLFLSFLYFFINIFTKNKIIIFLFLAVTSAIIYLSIFQGLTALIEHIVKENRDKRFSSYYATNLKYKMLNKEMGYSSFIPKDRLGNLSLEDKVIISNLFLLLMHDETLVDRIFDKKNELTESFLLEQKNEKMESSYKEAENKFNNKVKKINEAFDKYVEETKKVNTIIKNIDVKKSDIKKDYEDLKMNMFPKAYKQYTDQVNSFYKKVDLEVSPEKVNVHYNDLLKYFKNQKYSKAKKSYDKAMIKNFGYVIDPNAWCKDGYCPNKSKIIEVIKAEAFKKWDKESIYPIDLTQRDFFLHKETKRKIVNEINQKFGFDLKYDFNYSFDSFEKAYLRKIEKEQKNVHNKFENALDSNFGKDIKVGLSYKEFIQTWKPEIINEYGEKYGEILFKMIEDKNTEGFYSEFYEPYFNEHHASKFIISKEDLTNNKEHEEKGDASIKSMYVIPFAISMSLIASVLNIIDVIGFIILLLTRVIKLEALYNKFVEPILKICLYLFVFIYPYYIGKTNNVLKDYKILNKKHESDIINAYTEFLNWILVVEGFSYKLYEKLK